GEAKGLSKQRPRFARRESLSFRLHGDTHKLIPRSYIEQLLPILAPSGKRSSIGRHLPSARNSYLFECRGARDLISLKWHHVHFLTSGFPGNVGDPMSVRRELPVVGRSRRPNEYPGLAVRERHHPNFPLVASNDFSLYAEYESSISRPIRRPEHGIGL